MVTLPPTTGVYWWRMWTTARGKGLRPVVLLLNAPQRVYAALHIDGLGLHQLRALRRGELGNIAKGCERVLVRAVVVVVTEAGGVHAEPGEHSGDVALADVGARLHGELRGLAGDPELEVVKALRAGGGAVGRELIRRDGEGDLGGDGLVGVVAEVVVHDDGLRGDGEDFLRHADARLALQQHKAAGADGGSAVVGAEGQGDEEECQSECEGGFSHGGIVA